MHVKIKYWWSDDRKWFCILVDDGNATATVSLTPEEAGLLSMNAAPPSEPTNEAMRSLLANTLNT